MRKLINLCCIALLAFSTPTAAVKIKIATLSPDGTSWMRNMRAAGEEIERQTAGRVKLRFYPGGVMGDYMSMLRKIRIGQLHGGAVTGGALTAILPDTNVYGLPFLFRSLKEVDYLRVRIDHLLIERLADKGMISFGFAEGGFTHLMSNGDIGTLTQVKDRKVWVPTGDKISGVAMKALDISPISLPVTDVLTGLQTGLVDTVASPPVGAIALQWHTRVRNLLDLPLTYVYGTLVISEKTLSKLSAADRKALTDILTTTFERMNRENRQENAKAKAALRKQGIVFIRPEEAHRRQWEGTIDTAITELGNNGYFTRGLVKQVRALVHEYRVRQAKIIP